MNIIHWLLFCIWNFCCLDIAWEDEELVADEDDEDYSAPIDVVREVDVSDDDINLQQLLKEIREGIQIKLFLVGWI